MAGSVTPIAKAQTPQPDPLRVALAQAIATRREAEQAVEAHRTADDTAFDAVMVAEAELETARSNVKKARAADIEGLAQRIAKDGGASATGATSSATAAVVDAEDKLQICRETLAQIEASQAHCEIEMLCAKNNVIAAVSGMLAPIGALLFEEIRELRIRLAVDESMLRALLGSSYENVPYFPERTGMAGRAMDAREAPLKTLRKDAQQFLVTRLGDAADERRAVEAMLALWRPALCSLRENAETPLPSLGEPF